MAYRFSKTSMYVRLFATTWLVCSSSYAPVAIGEQKPIRKFESHSDGIKKPETLDELWQQSTLVVDGQVVSSRPANQIITPEASSPPGPPGEPVTLARTEYVIRVNRILKSDAVVTAKKTTIIVRRYGGTIDRGEYIAEIADEGFAQFKAQGRYVLFLRPARGTAPSEAVYFPVAGADSAFQMLGDRVVPLGSAIASQDLAKLGAQQFVATLAQRGGK